MKKDLYVLTADLDMETTMKRLLTRHQSLRIRKITFEVDRHFGHDPGCRSDALSYLRPKLKEFDYSIVMFDLYGCGDSAPRKVVQGRVACELARNGWKGRSSVVVIDPVLESWVWSGSEEVPKVLGLSGDYHRVRLGLEKDNMWPPERSKPPNPKEALKKVLRRNKSRHSSTIFENLARNVSLDQCKDPAFSDLLKTLRQWFPRIGMD